MKMSRSKRSRRRGNRKETKVNRSLPRSEDLSNRWKELLPQEDLEEKDERTYFCGFPLREDKINQLWDWRL